MDHPVLPLQPPLDYTAPELTRPLPLSARAGGLDARLSVDLFSLGLLTYHLISKRQLLRCNNNADTVSEMPAALKVASATCISFHAARAGAQDLLMHHLITRRQLLRCNNNKQAVASVCVGPGSLICCSTTLGS